MKKSACIDCNENDFRVLVFDHIKGAKRCNISSLIRKGSRATEKQLQDEIDKCVVRCTNCHSQATHSRARNESSTEQEASISTQNCLCGRKKDKLAISCLICNKASRSNQQISKYGDVETLVTTIKDTSWEAIARNLQVSSTAVRKYIRKNGYDTKTLTKLVSDTV